MPKRLDYRGLIVKMQQLFSQHKKSIHNILGQGDCLEDATRVKEMVEEAYPKAKVTISYVGPV